MKARVHVTLKPGVLDPQGEAVRHALGALGFDGRRRGADRQGDRARARRPATRRAARARGRRDVREAARQHRDRGLHGRARLSADARRGPPGLQRRSLDRDACPSRTASPTASCCATLACGVCRSDWHGWTGEHPRVKPGQIPGHEYCGEVVEAGPLARLAGRRPRGRAVHPRLRPLPGLPVRQPEHLPRPAPARLRRARRLRRVRRRCPSPTTSPACPRRCRRRSPPRLGCRVTTAWHALTGRADLRAGEWLAVHGTGGDRPLGDADPRPGARRPRRRRRRRAGEARRTRSASAPTRRSTPATATPPRRSATSPAAARTSRSRRSASPRPPTPRSNACGRSAATCRSGCRSATPRAWRST